MVGECYDVTLSFFLDQWSVNKVISLSLSLRGADMKIVFPLP